MVQGKRRKDNLTVKSPAGHLMTYEQGKFLKALHKHRLHIGKACNECGMSRVLYHQWQKEDPGFMNALVETREFFYDNIEHTLMTNAEIDQKAAEFWARTKMKDRGFVERTENKSVNVNVDMKLSDDEKQELLGLL